MSQAVILAGGKAMRMRPYTEDRPKAMVEIAGRPIIDRQINWLVENQVTSIVVSCGYRAELIEDFLGDGSRYGAEISYAVEDTPLGRGGGLKFAAKQLRAPNEVWFAFNGDVIADFSLAEFAGIHQSQHESRGIVATIALAQYQTRWGVADLDGDLIRGFIQDPKLPYWINAGIYAFQPEIVNLLPDIGDHEGSTFPDLAQKQKLGAYKIEGYWKGIDTAKDVEEATKEMSK